MAVTKGKQAAYGLKYWSFKDSNNGVVWHSRQHVWLLICQSWIHTLLKSPSVSLSKILYPYCLVMVDCRNEFKHDFRQSN